MALNPSIAGDGAGIVGQGPGGGGGVSGNLTVGTSTITGGTTGKVLYDNAGVIGELTIGAGADPLFLTQGLSVNATDPNVRGDPNDSQAVTITTTNTKLIANPGFPAVNCVEIEQNYNYGLNQFGAGSNLKSTPITLNLSHDAPGAGERFVLGTNMHAYGMGDAFLFTGQMIFAGGCINGDEGVGFSPAYYIQQQPNVTRANVISVARTTFSTTITANVTGSQNAQVIPVASTAGANANDWIIFGQAIPSGNTNVGVAQIISVGAGTITCICPNTFSSGTTITPALVLGLDTHFQFGQDRVVVNLSEALYQTGQVYQNGSGTLTGVGTTWSNGMVGGSTLNIGAISIDQDLMSDTPFTNSTTPSQAFPTGNLPLNSWYQIVRVSSATSLDICSFSAADDQSYRGNAPTLAQLTSSTVTITIASPAVVTWTAHGLAVGTAIRFTTTGALPTGIVANAPYYVASVTTNTFQLAISSPCNAGDRVNTSGSQSGTHTAFNGGYKIFPAARAFWVNPQGAGTIICETSSATWNVGDSVECGVSPYPDVHGWDLRFLVWSPGGTRRSAINICNDGSRMFGAGITVGINSGNISNLKVNSDVSAWGTGVSVDYSQVSYVAVARPGTTSAITFLNNGGTDAGNRINWSNAMFFGPNTANGGFDWNGLSAGVGGLVQLISSAANEENGRSNQGELAFHGYIGIFPVSNGRPFLRFHGPGGPGAPNDTVSANTYDIIGTTQADQTLNFVTYDGSANSLKVLTLGINSTPGLLTFGNFSSASTDKRVTLDAVTNLTAARTVKFLDTAGDIFVATTNTTGAGSAALGANSPATTNTAPYTWLKTLSHDGSTVYVPAWK